VTTYLLAGGGTAGHVNPLLAVADGLRARDPEADVLVLGTREGLEARLVPQRGYELLAVDKVPFPRRPNRDAFAFPVRFPRAVKTVRRYIRDRGVDAVIGFGGYAAAPAYVAARRERIPFVVHEANARPGMPLRGGELVGMPLRREIVDLDRAGLRARAAAEFGLDPDRPVLLVFGGSLGAQRLNEAIAGSWQDVLDAGWQILHATGDRSDLADPGVPGYALRRYLDRMDLAFALADLILSRSGAATVSEISALGIPAIYVPYAVGNGEQRLNAAAAIDAGAAILIEDAALDPERIRNEVVPLLGDESRRAAMVRAAARIGSRTGTEDLIALADRTLTR
jgi:UDP-N-acetylglucosamine--N-acetylmuramyl-(pentapeptide) pyrophosphoryl-undecaprenol N-acetylglucosamine transferase